MSDKPINSAFFHILNNYFYIPSLNGKILKHTILYENILALSENGPLCRVYNAVTIHWNNDEHNAVRTSAGIFDVSHMGEFTISGNDAENFLQLLTTNDIKKLSNGQAQYSTMCLEDGGKIDDLVIYRF
ncbi:MAG: hypothetical protein CM1200mP10_17830 [Candidatus Neomarinimicrobiota bacterium]|nr:MAG: hypothetical protein CM1200mP10_17830 [Candidatus Neomarinimicrobiota bacterium]